MEIVNGLDFQKNLLGIIPGGTGNGFRRSLKIPANPARALLGLFHWKPRRIDLGVFNGRYFLNVAGFGFDAAVTRLATVDNRFLRGYPAYVSAFLAKLATFKSFSAVLTCDGVKTREDKVLMAVISNGRFYGGQLCIAPRARVDDGKLDLCLIRKTGYAQTIALAVRAFFRSHLGHPAIYAAQCTAVEIETDLVVPVHIDGDIIGSLPAAVGVKPGLLSVIAPPP